MDYMQIIFFVVLKGSLKEPQQEDVNKVHEIK